MTIRVDLNADMGESFGPWALGDDPALLEIVTSANIACGMHAGDWDVMAATIAMASEKGVGIGAHPGFPDIQGFGRRRMDLSETSLANLVAYQLGAAQAIAAARGTRVRHLKLHGALGNMAAEDADLARACFQGALAVDPDLTMMVIAGTRQADAARDLGCNAACEIFADRAYNDDATLVDRKRPGAVIHDAATAAGRIRDMVLDGAIHTESGKRIETRIDTICLHGDTPGAVAIARAVRATLEEAGVEVRCFDGAPIPA